VKEKVHGSVDKYKAKLVALGYAQHYWTDFKETFSPIIKLVTIKVLLNLALNQNWNIRQIDIANAFLHRDLKENVYIQQSKFFTNKHFPDYVCKLKRSLYDLKQAPRA
jgi:hypothetical protein